jgi:peptide-methionine (S)-S-oxide reductase
LLAGASLLTIFLAPQNRSSAAPRAATKPVKLAPVPQGMAVATLGGGCFWSMEAIYKRLNGVKSAEPGYAGGKTG